MVVLASLEEGNGREEGHPTLSSLGMYSGIGVRASMRGQSRRWREMDAVSLLGSEDGRSFATRSRSESGR